MLFFNKTANSVSMFFKRKLRRSVGDEQKPRQKLKSKTLETNNKDFL